MSRLGGKIANYDTSGKLKQWVCFQLNCDEKSIKVKLTIIFRCMFEDEAACVEGIYSLASKLFNFWY